jgi:hypothetical protein
MKTLLLSLVAMFALASAWPVMAGDTAKDKKAAKTTAAEKHKKDTKKRQEIRTEHVTLTGSNIPRDIRRNGQVTDGPNQVIVIDNAAIANSGAADLGQALRLQVIR